MRTRIVSFLTGVIFTLTVLAFGFTAVAKIGSDYVKVDYNNIKATYNGKTLKLVDSNGNTVEPLVLNGSTYVPMRAFAEALGYKVDWNNKTKTVLFSDGTGTPNITDDYEDHLNDYPGDDQAFNDTTYQDEDVSAMEDEVLRLVNQERAKEGLKPLTMNEKLRSGAKTRAQEISQLFEHTRPDGRDFFTVYKESGVSYRAAGENIAYGYASPKEVMNGWMNSEGHRRNIMDPSFTQLAVGAYKSGGNLYWVQLFLG